MITLSYILTTYNKLSYLKITLPYLINACKEDEEIVLVDGGSTDGTKEYLQDLLNQKKIHQFISEKDFGEAHGTNKAILMAKGELFKIITDDDAFDFDVINFCKTHLLKNTQIDICGTDGLGISTINRSDIFITNYADGYMDWKKNKNPFLFCGLSYMIRKSSISKLGLLSTQFKIIDFEYSSRVSSIKSNIAFCNAYSFVNIVGIDSNSVKFNDSIRNEKKILKKLYPTISNLNYLKTTKAFYKGILVNFLKINNNNNFKQIDYSIVFKDSLDILHQKNSKIEMKFL